MDFHKEAFKQMLEERNVLVVFAKGLGLIGLFVKFLRLYSVVKDNDKKSNRKLHLILNASDIAQNLHDALLQDGVSEYELPKIITNELTSANRKLLYEKGGCLIITSRILVVDLLTNVLPAKLISGILVYNAHLVHERTNEAFIMRIFLQAQEIKGKVNPELRGFVKAFSNSPESLTHGFGKLNQTMTCLGVNNLFLWPRFQTTVKKCLNSHPPEVVELSQDLTPLMKGIQECIFRLIELCLGELKRCTNVDLSDLTVESGLFRSFDIILRSRLDREWHKVSPKTKGLVSDVGVLRKLLPDVLRYDATTFYRRIEIVKNEATKYLNTPRSMWMLTDAAATLFQNTKDRVYKVSSFKKRDESKPNVTWALDKNGRKFKLVIKLEENPKWALLREVLDEIETCTKSKTKDYANKINFGSETIIFCRDEATGDQLRSYLNNPKELQARSFDKLLASTYKMFKVTLINALANENDELSSVANIRKRRQKEIVQNEKREKHARLKNPSVLLLFEESEGTEDDIFSRAENRKRICHMLKHNEKPVETLTLEQRLLMLEYFDRMQVENTKEKAEDFLSDIRIRRRARYSLYPKQQAADQMYLLEELRPHFIVVYDPDVTTIRQVEVFQARYPNWNIRVYFLLYKDSMEEQRYLLDLKRESESFQMLINEKATLVFTQTPNLSEGDATALQNEVYENANKIIGYNLSTGEPLLANASLSRSRLTNLANKGSSSGTLINSRSKNKITLQKVLVDMREFRSVLPSMLHKMGIVVEPLTLEIGDYILSPEIAVERKSIADLFGSFNSGRLYKQAESMRMYYERPCLLIEFDSDRPFSLQAEANISDDITADSIVSKLVLLTLHFPMLRLLWSANPEASVEIFKLMKVNYNNPIAEKAAKVGVSDEQTSSENIDERNNAVAFELLRRLPGVNVHNYMHLVRNTKTLKEVFAMEKAKLIELIGETNGTKLYKFMNHTEENETESKDKEEVKNSSKRKKNK